jgi:hypothetical protein
MYAASLSLVNLVHFVLSLLRESRLMKEEQKPKLAF